MFAIISFSDILTSKYVSLKNLYEQLVAEHCIKVPVQSIDEFASSCHIEAIKDLLIQFGWQFAMTTRQFHVC
jgi:hypothetical protein